MAIRWIPQANRHLITANRFTCRNARNTTHQLRARSCTNQLLDQVRTLADQGNLIPIYRVLPADLETPVSVYLKLRQAGKSSFLLESVEKGEQLGRYSFIGVDPPLSLTLVGNQITVGGAGGAVLETFERDDPLAELSDILNQRNPIPVPDLPVFTGGAVGYWGYDIVRHFERLPETATEDLGLPDAVFLLADNLVIFDHVKHRLILLANARLRWLTVTAAVCRRCGPHRKDRRSTCPTAHPARIARCQQWQ